MAMASRPFSTYELLITRLRLAKQIDTTCLTVLTYQSDSTYYCFCQSDLIAPTTASCQSDLIAPTAASRPRQTRPWGCMN